MKYVHKKLIFTYIVYTAYVCHSAKYIPVQSPQQPGNLSAGMPYSSEEQCTLFATAMVQCQNYTYKST